MVADVELKPCPFCGSDAFIGGDKEYFYWVECRRCTCAIGAIGSFKDKQYAITAWNTRA